MSKYQTLLQGHHFIGISENLEMSRNSAKVSEKSGKRPKVTEKSGKCQAVCVVREILLCQLNKMLVTQLWCGRNTVTTVWTRSQIII